MKTSELRAHQLLALFSLPKLGEVALSITPKGVSQRPISWCERG
jgi:hypothetical protein